MNWRRAAGGFGTALLGHAMTVMLLSCGFSGQGDEAIVTWLIVALVGQALVFIGCMVAGIAYINRRDLGFGVGLLVGWAVGLIAAPFAGVGLCLLAAGTS